MEPLRRTLLALSLPRSGTRFLTKVLRNCGIKVGHELIKRDGVVSPFFAVEDVWYPGKHWTDDGGVEDESRTRRSDFVFEQVWHVVRDPRNVIPSMATPQLPRFFWCWAERHTGISCGLHPFVLRSMKTWVAWNELIEQNETIDLFLPIEEIDAHWYTIREKLGIEQMLVPEVPRDLGRVETGPREVKPLSFDDMRRIDEESAEAVIKMAHRYGYGD